MRWMLTIMMIMTDTAISDDGIIKNNEFTQMIHNRVCAPHYRNYEAAARQETKLQKALISNKGEDKESLMYKIELMNAISVMQDTRKNTGKSIKECLKNFK